MPSRVRLLTSPSSAAAVLLAVASCSPLRLRNGPSDRLSRSEQITHVLSRLTFGPRPGDADRVAAMGVRRWIDAQLRPQFIPDSALTSTLAEIPAWDEPAAKLTVVISEPQDLAFVPMAVLLRDTTARRRLAQAGRMLASFELLQDYLFVGKVAHAEIGERQLEEVLIDFWENHFSVYSGKMPTRDALAILDRDAIRPRAMGKFRDLLGAVAHSPAMLYYLDNSFSTADGLNENYARELMELHTLGVDGGYTQKDVQEVARALTGWTINFRYSAPQFLFASQRHDTGVKTVLGQTLPAGRGIEDGEEVLDILSRHPSTAHHIAYKLARRFVSDDPPPALVERAAATFMQTDGDIAAVMRTIVTSPEFFSRSAFRAKVKTPFDLVVSMRRALGIPADTTRSTERQIALLGQPLFGWLTPDGWPEKGDAWINSGTIYARIRFAGRVADDSVATMRPERWKEWTSFSMLPLEQQVDSVVKDILGGVAEPSTRAAMLSVKTESNDETIAGPQRLHELLSIAFASPEFQRR